MKPIAILSGAVALLATAGGAAWWLLAPTIPRYYTDADAIHRPQAAADPRDILWRPSVRLDAPLNSSGDDYEPRFAWDGLTLYFVRGKAGENADLYVTRRTAASWTTPQAVADANSEYDDLGPAPSPDGETLYFYSNRPGGQGGYDLWAAQRHGDAWQPPTNLGPAVNSPFNDYGPAPTPDGGTLLFSSNRPRSADARQPTPEAWPATLREDLVQRPYDLYATNLSPNGPSRAEPLAALNSPANEGAPCLSPVGDFVYFSSDRPGGAGGFDLYRARLLRGAWQPPTPLGDGLNTAANELDPGLTQLGYALYFSTDRPVVDAVGRASAAPPAEEIRPRYDLYFTTAREVFTEVGPVSGLDWAALLARLAPQLAWLLLGLFGLLLLLAFLRDMKDKRLSLLARCLLLSLLAHLVLMVSFGFWRVAAGVAEAVRAGGGGPIQISLAGAAAGGDIATQMRGNLTTVSPPPQLPVATPAANAPSPTLPTLALAALSAPPLSVPIEAPAFALPMAVEAAAASPVPEVVAPIAAFTAPPPAPDVALPAEAPRVATAEPVPGTPVAVVGDVLRTPGSRLDFPTSQPVARLTELPVAATNGDFVAVLRESLRADGGGDRGTGAGPPFVPDATPPTAGSAPPLPALSVAAILPDDDPASAALDVALPAPLRPGNAASRGSAESTPARDAEAGPAQPAVVAVATPSPSGSSAAASGNGAAPLFLVLRDVPASTGRLMFAADVAQLPGGGSTGIEISDAPTVAVGSPGAASGDGDGDGNRSAGGGLAGAGTGRVSTADGLVGGGPAPDLGGLPGLGGGEIGLPTEVATAPTATVAPLPDVAPRPGVLTGRIRDARSGAPLADATILLDLPDGQSRSVTSDARGRYALEVPPTIEHVAVSAAHDGYLPHSVNVSARDPQLGDTRVDFALEPQSADVIALEPSPEVHHLGNDRFEGSVNSQFQRESEGRSLATTFIVPADDPSTEFVWAELTLLARGVQCPHDLRINGRRLRPGLPESPEDGSFGEVLLRFDAALLRPGPNALRIATTSCMGDVDDFEFVNVQVRLLRE